MQTKNFEAAYEHFKAASLQNPRDTFVQYNLGLACQETKREREMISAFSKVIVMSDQFNQFSMDATGRLEHDVHLSPGCCRRAPGLVRWDSTAMPLKIYVCDGKTLPTRFVQLEQDQASIRELAYSTRNASFIANLPVAEKYAPAYKQCYKNGLHAWDWAVNENIISYRFTDDPVEADVIVFWFDQIHGNAGWSYYPNYPDGKHHPCIVFLSLEEKNWLKEDTYRKRLELTAAHEFGHVLGLEHGRTGDQLMYNAGPVSIHDGSAPVKLEVSASEKETLRALYSLPPDLVLLSVKGSHKEHQ